MVGSKKKLLGVVLALILVGSVGTTIWMAVPKNSLLVGMAYVNAPLVGATITIYDLAGNRLYEATNATLSSGVYIENVVWTWLWGVPSEFRVTATGGTVNGDPFNGTLVRYVENYDQNGYYAINTITTVIAAYKEANSSASYSQAETAVQAFLEIPSGVNIATVINTADHSTTFFDSISFINEANQNGGFNTYVDTLAAQVGQGQTHPFKGPPLVGAFSASDLFNFVGSNLAGSAIGWAEGKLLDQGLGLVMSLFGLGDKTAEQLQQMQLQLNQIQSSLTQMSATLDKMDQKLDSITYSLSQLSSQVAALQYALNRMDTDLTKVIGTTSAYDDLSKIDASYATLDSYAKCPFGSISTQTVGEWGSAVLSPTTGIPFALDHLNKVMTGHVLSNEEGLLETMVDSLIDQLNPTDSSYGRAYRTTVLNLYVGFENYFERLLYYEIEGLTLMAEGHNARNETAVTLNYISGTWQPMIKNQVNLFITQVERFVINAEGKAEMEFPNMGPIASSDYDAVNAYWQDHYGNPVPSIAEILPRADHFADVKLNGTGRFTARVLVFPQVTLTGKSLADLKPPVFKNMQTGALITPVGKQETVYIRKSGAQTNLFYYLFTYDLGTQPVGQYLLVSPTAVNTVSPYTGWFNADSNLRYEWWSYHEGVKLSLGSYATLTHITVSNDTYGNPYGYWGGIWADQNLG